MLDRVRYALPMGPLGRLAHALFVKSILRAIFAYRSEAIGRLFGQRTSSRAPSSAIDGWGTALEG
jgi:hypothetical protein